MLRINIAEKTGWTLEYIDSLSMADIGDFIAVTDATAKGQAKVRKMNNKSTPKGKRGGR